MMMKDICLSPRYDKVLSVVKFQHNENCRTYNEKKSDA